MGLQDSEFDKADWLEQHEPDKRQRLERLYDNQDDIDALLQQMLQERRALDFKYQELLGVQPWAAAAWLSAMVALELRDNEVHMPSSELGSRQRPMWHPVESCFVRVRQCSHGIVTSLESVSFKSQTFVHVSPTCHHVQNYSNWKINHCSREGTS